jgi:PKD repeat protein
VAESHAAPDTPPPPAPAPPPAPGAAPVANFISNPLVCYEDQFITFNLQDISSTPSGSPIVSWQWVFDGGVGLVYNMSGQYPAFRPQSVAAVYDVTLTITDAAGQTHSITKANYLEVVGIYDPRHPYAANPNGWGA